MNEEEIKREEKAEKKNSALQSKQIFQTLPHCSSCHMKQFDFWRKTPHAQAFETLVGKSQSKNKECLSCHSLGLGQPQGYSDPTRLASNLKTIREASSLDSEIKLNSDDAEALPLRTQIGHFQRLWVNVQCEHCHGAGHNHPFDQTKLKAITPETCLKCHTLERAPEWYGADHRPLPDLIAKKRSLMSCPLGD